MLQPRTYPLISYTVQYDSARDGATTGDIISSTVGITAKFIPMYATVYSPTGIPMDGSITLIFGVIKAGVLVPWIFFSTPAAANDTETSVIAAPTKAVFAAEFLGIELDGNVTADSIGLFTVVGYFSDE